LKISTGILGLGSKSTLFYLEELNRLFNDINKGFSTFPFKLLNTNFDEINSLLPKYSKALDTLVTKYFEQLLALDVTDILIPNITLHQTIDEIMKRANYSISIIHPLAETKTKLKANNVHEVLLFGTYHTMNSAYIDSYFNKNGLQIKKPSQEDMIKIDGIRKEVYNGIAISENTKLLSELIEKYNKVETIVIACTELSMINKESNIRCYDMAKIQLQETIRRATISQKI